jgi:hypothetical protein
MPAKLKEWNFQIGAFGVPATGKSHRVATRCALESQKVGAYVLVHDPTMSYSEAPYRKIWAPYGGIHHHDSPSAAADDLLRHPRGAHVVAADDAVEVLRLGIEVAAKSIDRAARSGTKMYHPVIIILDEVLDAEGLKSQHLDMVWKRAQAKRRHWGIGIAYTGQSCYVAHKTILMWSTELYAFRMMDPADHKRLRSVGLSKEQAEEGVPALRDRHCYYVENHRCKGMMGPDGKLVRSRVVTDGETTLVQ